MAAWTTKIIDVKEEFLHGKFTDNEEKIHMKIPQGFDKYY